MKNGLFFQEITFRTDFPGSNFLLPTLLAGGKWDFLVANLLLLISSPVNEPSVFELLKVYCIKLEVGALISLS